MRLAPGRDFCHSRHGRRHFGTPDPIRPALSVLTRERKNALGESCAEGGSYFRASRVDESAIVKSAPVGRSDPWAVPGLYAHLPTLTLAGGLAFWAANFATSLLPVAAEYRAAQSIAYLPMVLVESLVAGLIVGLLVSFFLLCLYDRLPTESPMLKATLLSFVALVVLTIVTWAAGSLGAPSDASRYVLMGTLLNIPRFLALGVAVGYFHKRSATQSRPSEGPG